MLNHFTRPLNFILLAAICLTAVIHSKDALADDMLSLQFADQHPRLFFRIDDLPRMRQAVQNIPMARIRFERLLKSVDTNRKILYPIPSKSTNRDWTAVAYPMSGNAARCGFLYQMTGEQRYAKWTKLLLISWAAAFDTKVSFQLVSDYHGKEVGAAGEGGNTMGFYFSGDILLNLSMAYDCVYNYLSADERQTIERDLFGRWVKAIEDYDHSRRRPGNAPDFMVGPGSWNGANMCNMGVTSVGFVLNQPRLYERGVNNFKIIVSRDMLADGFWIEEDLNYSDTCMKTFFNIAWMAKSSGYPVDLFNITLTHKPNDQYDKTYIEILPDADGTVTAGRSLKMYLDAHLNWQYPDFGPGNWGWTPDRGALNRSSRLIGMYLIGNKIYQDPAYGFILDNVDVNKASIAPAGIDPIYYAQSLDNSPPAATASKWYPHGKWIVLKSIEGVKYWNSDSMYAFMPYGHQRSKGLNPLTLDLYAFGKVLAPRVTLAGRAQNLTKSYQINEPAWNTVMIDGSNLSTFRGRIDQSTVTYRHFTDDIKIISAKIHVVGERRTELGLPSVERHPEEDRTMSRTLAMTDTYLVDVFRITYDKTPKYKHNFDYVLHGYGELTFQGKVQNIAQTKDITAVWKQDNAIGLRSTVLTSNPRGSTKFDKFIDTHSQYMIATRANYEEWFIVIHEPVKGESRIAKIESIAEQDDAIAVAITLRDGRVDLLALRTKPGNQHYQWTTPDGKSITLTEDYSFSQTKP